MAFDITLPNISIISTLAAYAPSLNDMPSFWEHAYNEISQNNHDFRLILGQYLKTGLKIKRMLELSDISIRTPNLTPIGQRTAY